MQRLFFFSSIASSTLLLSTNANAAKVSRLKQIQDRSVEVKQTIVSGLPMDAFEPPTNSNERSQAVTAKGSPSLSSILKPNVPESACF